MLNKSSYKKGFTLIEVLVVVLIIGILAAIALPQYEKAIRKSKLAQLDVIINAVRKNAVHYVSANGRIRPKGKGEILFTGARRLDTLDMPGNCEESEERCAIENIEWAAGCVDANPPFCALEILLDDIFDDETFISLRREKVTEDIWYIDRIKGAEKEICQWFKDRNYPARPDSTHCEEFGVTFDEYIPANSGFGGSESSER